MYFQTHFAILIAISASINAAVIGRQDFSNEIVYLSNCYDAGDFSSELDYYANREESRAGQFPDSIAVTASHTNTPWDNLHFFGATFPSGVHFTITTMNGNTKPGELSGQANNGFSTFTCFREQDVPLYASGSKTCNKLFSCAHNNHVEFQETKFSFSSKMVEVVDRDVPHNGPEVFNNVFNIINQDACGNSPQPIGNGCNINFACDATNANILNAMAHFLVEDMGPSITSSTRTIPRQGSCEDPNQPMDPDFCNGYDEHVAQFPATGKINVENHFSNDPQSSSQNSQLTYEITCPAAEQTCDKNICDAALGSATAAAGIISPEIGGILGIIGPLECLICA